MKNKIGLWKGKPVEELEKPELLEIIDFMGKKQLAEDRERESLGDDYYDLLARMAFRINNSILKK